MLTYTTPLKGDTSALRMADNCIGRSEAPLIVVAAGLCLGSSAAAVEGPAPAVAASSMLSWPALV